MYTTKNKKESRDLIKKLELNTVPEIFIYNTEIEKMIVFFDMYKEDLYIVRDAEHSSSKYYFVKNIEECIEVSKNYDCKIILAVSINTYKNKLLLGAVEFKSDNTLKITATTDIKKDHRTMFEKPDFDYDTDIFDKRLSLIPEFDFLYEYIVNKELYDIIVEFTIYDKVVGDKQERILINELRNY